MADKTIQWELDCHKKYGTSIWLIWYSHCDCGWSAGNLANLSETFVLYNQMLIYPTSFGSWDTLLYTILLLDYASLRWTNLNLELGKGDKNSKVEIYHFAKWGFVVLVILCLFETLGSME